MVKIIMGLKGSGKTKQLISMVTKAVEEEHGNVVCVEKDKKLTYDIPYSARLIHASDYEFGSFTFFKGFISGLYAGNYDITHVFVDNFFKMFDEIDSEQMKELLEWLDIFGEKHNVKFTISATVDPDTVSDAIKKYC